MGSPTNWNAVFDFLLVALANLPSQLNITGPHGNLHPVTGIGYADDLLTAAGSSEGLQDQADLVSIFAMIFGLDRAHPKLRTLTTHWSGTPWHQTKMSPIKVHKSSWNSINVPIQFQGQLKLLGTIFDYDNSGKTQYEKTDQQLRQASSNILSKRASQEGKIHAFNTVAISRALYTAQHSSLSLEQLRRLDVSVNDFYKRVSENMKSFPNEVLYSPIKTFAGLG